MLMPTLFVSVLEVYFHILFIVHQKQNKLGLNFISESGVAS